MISARHAHVTLPTGPTVVIAHDERLVGVYHVPIKHSPDREVFGRELSSASAAGDPVIGPALEQLSEYFAGQRQTFDVPFTLHGTDTQKRVWQLLMDIPFGELTTYGQIAQQLGKPGMAQAVGGAVGHNPISIIVPCHRVMGADGGLVGYAGGLERKRMLLELEGHTPDRPLF